MHKQIKRVRSFLKEMDVLLIGAVRRDERLEPFYVLGKGDLTSGVSVPSSRSRVGL